MPTVVVHRETFEVRRSVNLPDFPYSDWVGGWQDGAPMPAPDLSRVIGQPKKYWAISPTITDFIHVALLVDRNAADAAEAAELASREEVRRARRTRDAAVQYFVDDESGLPDPSPYPGMLYWVQDVGGIPVLAVSTEGGGWAFFARTGQAGVE